MNKDTGVILQALLQQTEGTDLAYHHTHPPENQGNHLLLTEESHGRKEGLQLLSKITVWLH